jgi:hypothetical protein
MPCWEWVRKTIPQDIIRTTEVRMAVAKWEFTFETPIFARIVVAAANRDDPRASTNHIWLSPLCISF